MALDDNIAKLRHDATLLEKTKTALRAKRQRLGEFERRLKHREERLSEKEEDLAERQKLTPYYIPYPINAQAPSAPAPAPAPAPTNNNNNQPAANSNSSPPPASSLGQTQTMSSKPSSSFDSSSDLYDSDFDDSLQGLNSEEENSFLSLLQEGMRLKKRQGAVSSHTQSDDLNWDSLS